MGSNAERGMMSNTTEVLEPSDSTALVEVLPGTALVFGQVPDGLELLPVPFGSLDESGELTRVIAKSSSILNVSAQVATGLPQAQGLVRLAPETVQLLRAGATPLQSGGYNVGALAGANGKIVAQVRWLPASGAGAVGMIAAVAPAIAMMAMQMQLDEIASIAKRNLELTETVLSTLQHEQWAELAGLEQSVSRALDEANAIGQVTPLLWENVAGSEAALRKQGELYRRHVQRHAAELARRKKPGDLRDYLEQHRVAILFDLRSLVVAHRSLFLYQVLRIERVRAGSEADPREAALPKTIAERAGAEYAQVTGETVTLIDTLNREIHLMAELLPQKRTIPFSGGRKDGAAAARVSQELLEAVDRLAGLMGQPSVTPGRPETVYVEADEPVAQDLRILRWHLQSGERLQAIATADAPGGIPNATDTLIVVTDQRVIEAKLSAFRKSGAIQRSIPNEAIRYMRLRDDPASGRADLDLITVGENLTWRFAKGSASAAPVRALGALIAERMGVPAREREALIAAARPSLEA